MAFGSIAHPCIGTGLQEATREWRCRLMHKSEQEDETAREIDQSIDPFYLLLAVYISPFRLNADTTLQTHTLVYNTQTNSVLDVF